MSLPDESERERLILLIEECAEVQRAATKILRFGYASQDNRDDLSAEIGDLEAAIGLIIESDDVDPLLLDRCREQKMKSYKTGTFIRFQKRGCK